MVLGRGEPTVRHSSKHDAQREAERLANQHPGYEFIVLEALASVAKSDVRWKSLEDKSTTPDADIPF